MSEPSERDSEMAKELLQRLPPIFDQPDPLWPVVGEVAKAIAAAREEGRREERARCVRRIVFLSCESRKQFAWYEGVADAAKAISTTDAPHQTVAMQEAENK